MFIAPPLDTHIGFQKSILTIALISALFNGTTQAADYQYDRDHSESLIFIDEDDALNSYYALQSNSDVTEKSFELDLSGFEPQIGNISGIHLHRQPNVNINNNTFSYNLTGANSSSSFYGVSAVATDGLNVSNNSLAIVGSQDTQTKIDANHIHMIDVSYTKSSYTIGPDGISRPSPVYGSNGVNISSNTMQIGNIISNATVSVVSATYVGGTIDNNSLLITNSELKRVTGVSASSQVKKGSKVEAVNVTNNHISATNSKFNEIYGVQVAGASSQPITFGSVSNNSLTLNNVTLRKVGNKSSFIYAIAQDVTGGNSRQIGDYPTVTNGTLTISGNFTVVEAGSAQIGAARTSVLNVSNNNLLIENATVKFQQGIAELFGGKTTYAATSDNNSVRISNSKVLIGSSTITGGEATEGSANGNNVTIEKNSEVNASLIVGAFAAESVTNASILIDSSKVSGNIAIFDGKPSTDGDGSITIRGDSDLSAATLLPYVSKSYKGNADTTLVLDEFSGNVRNLGYSATSDSSKSSGFDHIRMLNQNWDTSKAILNVEGNAVIRKSSFTDESLSFTNSESVKQGGTITLIKGDLTYLDPDEVNERELKSTAGTSLEFSGILNFDQENITYTIGEVDNSHQTLLVGDSRLAAATFVNQGSDLLERVFHGFSLSQEKYGLMTFATAEGAKNDYDLSSPIRVNGWNFLGGVRHIANTYYGDLTNAAFVEYGRGNYRTENNHLGFDFRSDGSLSYYGLGFAARLKTRGNFYAEGSLRAGKLSSKIDHALMDASGNFYNADTTSLYSGFHIGTGLTLKPSANMEIDSYAKYFFTYTDSDSFKVKKYNEKYKFDSIASHRLRLGSRFNVMEGNTTFLFGIAGEYEFSGESNMVVAGGPKQTTDLSGFSAFAEVGLSLRPSTSSPWQFDAQIRGWEGTRDAISGTMTINYLY